MKTVVSVKGGGRDAVSIHLNFRGGNLGVVGWLPSHMPTGQHPKLFRRHIQKQTLTERRLGDRHCARHGSPLGTNQAQSLLFEMHV